MKLYISVSRIGQTLTDMMYRQARGNKASGTIIMNPHDFLVLTTTNKAEYDHIMEGALTTAEYNHFAKTEQNIHMPWLDVTLDGKKPTFGGKPSKTKPGRVVGHEGRHRAAALIKEGIDKMVVLLQPRIGGMKQFKKPSQPGGWPDTHLTKADFPGTFYAQYNNKKVKVNMSTYKTLPQGK